MILDDKEIEARLESPMNLINKLRSHTNGKANSLAVFKVPASTPTENPILPPSIDDLIDDIDSKVKLAGLNGKALDVMNSCLDELKIRLPEVQRPEKLSSIASEMGKITASFRNDGKERSGTSVQVMVYAPQIIPKDNFDVIHLEG